MIKSLMSRGVVCLVLTAMTTGILNVPATAEYSGGSGTADDPYRIATAADLIALGDNTQHYEMHFVLVSDIDLAAYTFVTAVISPTVTAQRETRKEFFSGVFDGNGHVIRNLTIDNQDVGIDGLGLFGKVVSDSFDNWPKKTVVIRNLGLVNVSVNGSKSKFVGSLVGSVDAYGGERICNIEDCYATGSVSAAGYVGGLCGRVSHTYITSCWAAVNVMGYRSGGLLGQGGFIKQCHATGQVTGSYIIGGLIGSAHDQVEDSYATGEVIGVDSSFTPSRPRQIGGLVGSSGADIKRCYATGPVTGTEDVGGLVGEHVSHQIEECYASGFVTGRWQPQRTGSSGWRPFNVGGFVGSVAGGKISRSCSAGPVVINSAHMWGEAIGGLVGLNEGHIQDCYAVASVNCDGIAYDVGGLVGRNRKVKDGLIDNSYAAGMIWIAGNSDRVGGLTGWSSYDPNVFFKSYFLATIGPDNGYGFPLSDLSMRQRASFEGWDFVGESANGTENVWQIIEGVSYPYLSWQDAPVAPHEGNVIDPSPDLPTDPVPDPTPDPAPDPIPDPTPDPDSDPNPIIPAVPACGAGTGSLILSCLLFLMFMKFDPRPRAWRRPTP